MKFYGIFAMLVLAVLALAEATPGHPEADHKKESSLPAPHHGHGHEDSPPKKESSVPAPHHGHEDSHAKKESSAPVHPHGHSR